jgi:hypothetical protein
MFSNDRSNNSDHDAQYSSTLPPYDLRNGGGPVPPPPNTTISHKTAFILWTVLSMEIFWWKSTRNDGAADSWRLFSKGYTREEFVYYKIMMLLINIVFRLF